MKDFKQIAKEMREGVQRAIMMGPIDKMDDRLKVLLDQFEASIVAYADDEAVSRAKKYYESMEGPPDGDPVVWRSEDDDK